MTVSETSVDLRAAEKALVKAHCPAIAWRTLALALALWAVQSVCVAGALAGTLPLWLATILLGLCAYGQYTVIHESIHGNIVRGKRGGFVHAALGRLGAIALFLSWPLLRRTHLLHHSHTNTEKDPDHTLVAGSFWRLMGIIARWPLHFVVPFWLLTRLPLVGYRHQRALMTRREWVEHMAVMHAQQAIVWGLILTGNGMAVLALWLIPALLGVTLLGIGFQWLPHRPFNKTSREDNAYLFRAHWADWVLFGQNLHLTHHQWPAVPFYRYRQVTEGKAALMAAARQD